MVNAEEVISAIKGEGSFTLEHLEVLDESNGCGDRFKVIVVSNDFGLGATAKLDPLKFDAQHRLVSIHLQLHGRIQSYLFTFFLFLMLPKFADFIGFSYTFSIFVKIAKKVRMPIKNLFNLPIRFYFNPKLFKLLK